MISSVRKIKLIKKINQLNCQTDVDLQLKIFRQLLSSKAEKKKRKRRRRNLFTYIVIKLRLNSVIEWKVL